MGNGRFDHQSYVTRATAYKGRKVEEYTARTLNPNLNPVSINLRESRDSEQNPESTAVILGLDLTGSMGFITDYFSKEGIGKLCTGIYEKQPVTDPHIMLMGIGDVLCDAAPLQVSQFEAEVTPLMDQLEMLWIHHGGGGNGSESYTLPWLFAATRTEIDCWEKRQKKGYIITIGDEPINRRLGKSYLSRVMGTVPPEDFQDWTAEELLEKAREKYNVFHLITDEGYRGKDAATHDSWTEVLGEDVMHVADHKNLAEVIITKMLISEGMDPDEAASQWDKDVADQVKTAVNFRT